VSAMRPRPPISQPPESAGCDEHLETPHAIHGLAEANCTHCHAELTTTILEWAGQELRRLPWRSAERSPYQLVVAEVLLQQTTAAAVARILPDLVQRYPDWTALTEASLNELEAALQPLGLHRRRARVLQALAQSVCHRGALPSMAEELSTLPGIGQYMSRAIAVQLTGERVAPIDVNVARVLERIFGPRQLADIRYDPYLQALALAVLPHDEPALFAYAILDFAAAICRARHPRCSDCPVLRCGYRATHGAK